MGRPTFFSYGLNRSHVDGVVPFSRPYPPSRQFADGVAYRAGESDTPLLSSSPSCDFGFVDEIAASTLQRDLRVRCRWRQWWGFIGLYSLTRYFTPSSDIKLTRTYDSLAR